jgi:hypothetical protein
VRRWERRMKRRKRKNKILKATTYIAIFGALISGCCLDSKSYIPMVILGICLLYISLIALANMD